MVGLYRASGQHETGRVRGSAGARNVRGGARRSGGAPLRAYVLLSRETICEVEAGRFERRYATKTKLRHLREVQAEPTDFTIGPKHNSPLRCPVAPIRRASSDGGRAPSPASMPHAPQRTRQWRGETARRQKTNLETVAAGAFAISYHWTL